MRLLRLAYALWVLLLLRSFSLIQELVTLCTQWPDEPLTPTSAEAMGGSNSPDKRLYKYPFVASEVLCADVPRIQDAMTRSPDLLYSILSALDAAPAGRMETMRATYVAKVVGALLRARSPLVLAHLAARSRPDLITSLLRQVALLPVADLLVRLLDPPPSPYALAMDSLDAGTGGWEGLCSSVDPSASNPMAPSPSVPVAALQLLARTDVLARLVGVIADHAVPAGTLGPAAGGLGADGSGDGVAVVTAGGGGNVEVPDDRRVREAALANAAGTLLELSRQLLQIRASGVAIPDPLNVFARGDLCGQLLDAGLAAAAAGYPGALHIALDTLGRLLTTPANVALVPPAEQGDGVAAASDEDDLFDWDGTGGGAGEDGDGASPPDVDVDTDAPADWDAEAPVGLTNGDGDAADTQAALLPPPPRLVSTAAVEAVLIARLSALMDLVVDEEASQQAPPPTLAGSLPAPPPPLGVTRLMVIELLCALFALGGEEAVSALAAVGVPGLLLRRFATHRWSSMLHTTVTDAIVALLSTGRPYAHRALFAEGFVQWLIETWTAGEATTGPAARLDAAGSEPPEGAPAEAQDAPAESPSKGAEVNFGTDEVDRPAASEYCNGHGSAADAASSVDWEDSAVSSPAPVTTSNTANADALRAAGGVATFRPGYMGHLIQLFVALGDFMDTLPATPTGDGDGGDTETAAAAADGIVGTGLEPSDVASVKALMEATGSVGTALRVQQKALCGERPGGGGGEHTDGEEDEDLYEDATPLFDMNEVIHNMTLPDNAVHINRFAARLLTQSGVNASDLLGDDEEEALPVGGLAAGVAALEIQSDDDDDSDDNSAYSTPEAYADDEGEAAAAVDEVPATDGQGSPGSAGGIDTDAASIGGAAALKPVFGPLEVGTPWPAAPPGVVSASPPPPLDSADVGPSAPPAPVAAPVVTPPNDAAAVASPADDGYRPGTPFAAPMGTPPTPPQPALSD